MATPDLKITVEYKPTLHDIEVRNSRFIRGSQAFFAIHGEALKAEIQSRVPVKTGFLRNHVRIFYFGNQYQRGFECGWYWEDFAEVGYPPYYLYIEFGTAGRNATPSLGPSWGKMEQILITDLENSFNAYYSV